MIRNFEILRLKKAGVSNLGILKLIDYQEKHEAKLTLRQLARIAEVKAVPNFIESYKSQDVKRLREQYKTFPSFSILDDIYPEWLKEMYNPPTLLFYQGNLKFLNFPKLGFVGSREMSKEAPKITYKLIEELKQSFVIVSGLARGVDTSSHVAAIKQQTPTIAVIGNGLDISYPKENRKLQEYLATHELVLSEYLVGEPPLKFHFPERNRIIAGLSRGIVVVEAKQRSGSLITSRYALEGNREVFAVPGDILNRNASGCNQLIQQGAAKLITHGQDILDEFYLYEGNFLP
ncbi:DNA-processing protein DprA [Lactococcus garvieae]|uniref:DNA-processing protein DprA n=1 Tax=Lactococcus garvieae TaxID=1363 RepID=A0AA46YSH1_9LACT|nr:DNA-processing protein DprA [Lactococcus garvieae]UYT09674.1 DNA-processing protein DprA [Lactococcus garvieae]UYT11606.1 DNA-processing protein DprA [Lactococcus garvieae]